MTKLADRARAAFAAQNWAEAFVDAQRAIALASGQTQMVQIATIACLEQNQPEAALPYAEAWDLLDPTVEAKYVLRNVYWQLNRHDAMHALSRQILALPPPDADGWLRIGQALLPSDVRGAGKAFRRSFILRPTHVMALGNWFHLSFSHLTDVEIADILRGLIATGLPVAGECMAQRYLMNLEEMAAWRVDRHRIIVWDDLGYKTKTASETHARWRTLALAWRAAEPTSAEATENFIFATLADHKLRNLDAAVAIVRGEAPGNVVGTYITNPDDFAALDAHWDAELGVFPPTRVLAESFTAAPRAFFFGCDQAYFDTFGAELMASFLYHAPQLALHIHVINPDEARLQSVFDAAPRGALLRITVEWVDPEKTQIPEYAHVARFVRFAQFLQDYPDQLWMVDADCTCRRDPSWLCDLLTDGVALALGPARVECHNTIGAHPMGIGASAPARRYVRLVAAYIARTVASGRLVWGCDQAALYLVMIYLKGIGAAPEITGIPVAAGDRGDDTTFPPSKSG